MGAGAVGSYIGAFLARQEFDITHRDTGEDATHLPLVPHDGGRQLVVHAVLRA